MLWESTIKIAFKPHFTESFKQFIKKEVSPEFTSDDEKTHQYFVSSIEDATEQSNVNFMEEDLNILGQLFKEGIEYVEF